MRYDLQHLSGADLKWFLFALTMTDGEESSGLVATFATREAAAEYVALKGGTLAD